MSQTFAEVVEEVKQLSFSEKEELRELLRQYLIEERRREILESYIYSRPFSASWR